MAPTLAGLWCRSEFLKLWVGQTFSLAGCQVTLLAPLWLLLSSVRGLYLLPSPAPDRLAAA